jgi:hypothetical protein
MDRRAKGGGGSVHKGEMNGNRGAGNGIEQAGKVGFEGSP